MHAIYDNTITIAFFYIVETHTHITHITHIIHIIHNYTNKTDLHPS